MDNDEAARLASWLLRRLGVALGVIGGGMALGAVVALVADSLAWFAIGTALGLAIAGVNLRDTNAARDLGAGRPVS